MDLNQLSKYTLQTMFFINVNNTTFVNMLTAIAAQVSYYKHVCCSIYMGVTELGN